MTINTKFSGFILAGGKSKRMGTDKAFLRIQDEPLLKRMVKLISQFSDKIAISAQDDAYAEFNVPMIADIFTDLGPIAGIHSCLLQSSSEWNLIISVDVPFLNAEFIRFLISNTGDADCIIPRHQFGIEPLVGLYHRRVLPEVERMIESGDYKLMNLLTKLNTQYLDCNQWLEKYPKLFTNLNRPEDYLSI